MAVAFYTLFSQATSESTGTAYADFAVSGATSGRGLLLFAIGGDNGTFDVTSIGITGETVTAASVTQRANGMAGRWFYVANNSSTSFTARVNYDSGTNGWGMALHILEVTGHDTTTMVPTTGTLQTANPVHIVITTAYDNSGVVSYIDGGSNEPGTATGFTAWDCANHSSRARIFYDTDAGTAGSIDVTPSDGWNFGSTVEIKAAGASGQTLLPDSDVTTTGWTPSTGATLYGVLDEATASDTDYITTGTLNAECEIGLMPGSTPGAGSRNLKVRTPAGFAPTGGMTTTLLQGLSIVQTFTTTTAASNTDYTFSVTEAITDYSDLRVRIKSTA